MTKQEFTDKLLHMKVRIKPIVITTDEFHMMWKAQPIQAIRDLKRYNPILKSMKFSTRKDEDEYIIYRIN